MKIRNSTSYLIISSAHLGINKSILGVFSQVAKYFNAQAMHLGSMVSEKEASALEKLTESAVKASDDLDNLSDGATDAVIDRVQDKYNDTWRELKEFTDDIGSRVEDLTEAFEDVSFVVPKDSGYDIEEYFDNVVVYDNEKMLSKYIMVSGVQPVSDYSTIKPANRNAINALKHFGKNYSWIVPHPVPTVIPYAKPGLNNVHHYYSVGCLKNPEKPSSKKQMYQASHAPSAMLVVIDDSNGEFHANHLDVDFLEKKGYGKQKPIVLYDGLVFDENGVKENELEDRAVFESDDHEPAHHSGVLGAMRGLVRLYQPKTFINGGDASNCCPVSRHELAIPGLMEGKRIKHMILGLRSLLDAQTNVEDEKGNKIIENKILIDSNHHAWLTNFVELNPQLKGLLDWDSIQKEYFPDWVFLSRDNGYAQPYSFGDYTVRHGDQEAFAQAELIFDKYLCGHWHRHQKFRRTVSVGAGCELDPRYTANKMTNWLNQITTLTRYKGITAVAPKIVLHDCARNYSRFCYRNEIYEVVRHDTTRS
jgi:hypothetical protein